jgi:hypothetical protein
MAAPEDVAKEPEVFVTSRRNSPMMRHEGLARNARDDHECGMVTVPQGMMS